MLVHIVTPANRSAYSDYLPKMFALRRSAFPGGLGRDDIDGVAEVEYLLALDEYGKLVAASRFAPTTGPHLLAGAWQGFVERPYERSAKIWEWTHYAPPAAAESPNAQAALAYMLAAAQEWGLSRGVGSLIAVADDSIFAIAARMGWKKRLLGGPAGDENGDAAVEFTISAEALKSTRRFWKITQAVTYLAPPPITAAPITRQEIGIFDAVCGLADHEYEDALRALSTLGQERELIVQYAPARANA